MSNPEVSKCCTCGYTWRTGQSGSHSCVVGLCEQRDELLEALEMAMEIGDQCSRGYLGLFQKKARAAIAKAKGDAS